MIEVIDDDGSTTKELTPEDVVRIDKLWREMSSREERIALVRRVLRSAREFMRREGCEPSEPTWEEFVKLVEPYVDRKKGDE